MWRYFFLVQPHDLPKRLIGCNPEGYLRWTFDEWCGTPGALTRDAVAEYVRCFDLATVHATCEDYRAGATIDLRDDAADAQRQLECPTLVLWSRDGIGATYDVERIWKARAPDMRGKALACSHFLAEERPEDTAIELLDFIP